MCSYRNNCFFVICRLFTESKRIIKIVWRRPQTIATSCDNGGENRNTVKNHSRNVCQFPPTNNLRYQKATEFKRTFSFDSIEQSCVTSVDLRSVNEGCQCIHLFPIVNVGSTATRGEGSSKGRAFGTVCVEEQGETRMLPIVKSSASN